MRRYWQITDLVIRYCAIVGLVFFGLFAGVFALAGIGAPNLDLIARITYIGQIMVCGLLISLLVQIAHSPSAVTKYIALSERSAEVLARVVVYPIGITAAFLLIRQVLIMA